MKLFAFYLPQFHTFPENDLWWGKGFTEWTNTKKGKPLFKNHYQPHIPLNENYYDLVNQPDTMRKQVDMAKEYRLSGFCFYHYWFENDKKLMEKPIEMFLNSDIEMEFCLCWANENWTKKWDGKDSDILIKQNYGDKQGWINHFIYLKQFFQDRRYAKDVKGRPILVIYKPGLIEYLDEMLNLWNEMAIEIGFEGICYIYQYPDKDKTYDYLFDYHIEFEPAETVTFNKNELLKKYRSAFIIINQHIGAFLKHRSYQIYDYRQVAKASSKRKIDNKTMPGVFTSWDNTARRGDNAVILTHSSPDVFRKYLINQIKKLDRVNKDGIIFINAWNEWAEGAHLEPDKKYGFDYLNAVKEAVDETNI